MDNTSDNNNALQSEPRYVCGLTLIIYILMLNALAPLNKTERLDAVMIESVDSR